jgi:type 2 lantibiotic biosynthesis protein LanM
MHFENVITSDGYPVLIGLETLLHPMAKAGPMEGEENAFTKATRLIHESVLRFGILPRWERNGSQVFDSSVLGKWLPKEIYREMPEWCNINTDLMEVRKGRTTCTQSTAFLDDELSPDHFIAEMIKGFTETYLLLASEKNAIAGSSPWKALSKQTLRFVFRPSKLYAQIQQNLLYSHLLKNGIDRSVYLDILYKGMTNGDHPPLWWPLVQAEQNDLEMMDMPHFSVQANSDGIELPDGKKIANYFHCSGYKAATLRLQKLNEQDLQQQITFIKNSISSRNGYRCSILSTSKEIKGTTTHRTLTKEHAIQEGHKIAALLIQTSITAGDGSTTWIAPTYDFRIKKYVLDPISDNLYDGNAGVALFFAALFKITGQSQYKDFALSVLLPLQRSKEVDLALQPSVHTGGYAGYAGVVYSFLKVGLWTGNLNLIHAATEAAFSLTRSREAEAQNFDITNGTAGTLLSLFQIYKVTNDQMLYKKLISLGEHILKGRQMTTTGHHSWKSSENNFLTGFSHVSAGIAYALLKLYKISRDRDYKAAALEAIAYESSVFDTIRNNWPDFREQAADKHIEGKNKFMCSWCHGAAGIGLPG